MSNWTRDLPTRPGVFDHRNLENAKGRVPIQERVMWVGYVNWNEDKKLGHGTKPTDYMPRKLRACRIEHPMTTDSLTVQEWGGEWRPLDVTAAPDPLDTAAQKIAAEMGARGLRGFPPPVADGVDSVDGGKANG